LYREPWRPQFHFTPERNWMNDPNGLAFFDGEYHLFYQHNPFGDEWGHMSWGHAASPDLVHWQQLPLALAEEDGEMVFSGCVVADPDNTSGLGEADKAALVAIYTAHRTRPQLQTQCLAFSLDRGRTWSRYAGNPVLDVGESNFRDPKVFWHDSTRRWIMVVSRPERRTLGFYCSPNLKDWAHLGDFGPAGSTAGIWECPDLFPLRDGGDGRERWVLVVSVGGGAPAGGSGCQYFVGEFDGDRFTEDLPSREPLWLDYGRDLYSFASWSGIPGSDGRRLGIGWMSNWDYAGEVPTSPWRGAMTVPRELTLRRTADGLRLCQRPVREIRFLSTDGQQRRSLTGETATEWLANLTRADGQAGLAVDFVPGEARRFGVRVRHGESEETTVTCDIAAGELALDRSRSGVCGFAPDFAGVHRAPIGLRDGHLRLEFLCDASSVEVFANDGEIVITDVIFPQDMRLTFEVFGDSADLRLESIEVWSIDSIWP
jgi:fructan beta-fructosidase